MSGIVRLRSSPRVYGTMQNVQYWLQPCMMLTNAVTDCLAALAIEQMLANGRFAPLLFRHVHDFFAPGRR